MAKEHKAITEAQLSRPKQFTTKSTKKKKHKAGTKKNHENASSRGVIPEGK